MMTNGTKNAASTMARLSNIETRVMTGIGRGLGDREIAVLYGLSFRVVTNTVQSIRHKVGAYSRVNLARIAIAGGLAPLHPSSDKVCG